MLVEYRDGGDEITTTGGQVYHLSRLPGHAPRARDAGGRADPRLGPRPTIPPSARCSSTRARSRSSCSRSSRAGDTIGLLEIVDVNDRVWDDDDVEFCRALCDIVAIAVRNAVLFAELQETAARDKLTGLYNRRLFEEQFEAAVARSLRTQGGPDAPRRRPGRPQAHQRRQRPRRRRQRAPHALRRAPGDDPRHRRGLPDRRRRVRHRPSGLHGRGCGRGCRAGAGDARGDRARPVQLLGRHRARDARPVLRGGRLPLRPTWPPIARRPPEEPARSSRVETKARRPRSRRSSRPSRPTRRRAPRSSRSSACSIRSGSCVPQTTAAPVSRARSSSSRATASAFAWSSRAVGSSASSRLGRAATARATATRSRWPLERSSTRREASAASPTAASASAARARASSASIRRSARPSSTFSAAVRNGTRPVSWLTSAMRSARKRARPSRSRSESVSPSTWTLPAVGTSVPARRSQKRRLPRAGRAGDGGQAPPDERRVQLQERGGRRRSLAVRARKASHLGDALAVARRAPERRLLFCGGRPRRRPAPPRGRFPPRGAARSRASECRCGAAAPPRGGASRLGRRRSPRRGRRRARPPRSPVRPGRARSGRRSPPIRDRGSRARSSSRRRGRARRSPRRRGARWRRPARRSARPRGRAAACVRAPHRRRPAAARRPRARGDGRGGGRAARPAPAGRPRAHGARGRSLPRARAGWTRARGSRARPRARASSAGRRSRGALRGSRARPRRPSLVRSRSCTRTLPAVGWSSAASMRRRVDLPEPLGPSTTQISPSCTSSVSPWRATTPPSGAG